MAKESMDLLELLHKRAGDVARIQKGDEAVSHNRMVVHDQHTVRQRPDALPRFRWPVA